MTAKERGKGKDDRASNSSQKKLFENKNTWTRGKEIITAKVMHSPALAVRIRDVKL